MDNDKLDDNITSLPSVSLFRGIYNRVATRLGVDPSYVSRVARGERKSAVVEKALAEEVSLIREHLNNHHQSKSGLVVRTNIRGGSWGTTNHNQTTAKPLAVKTNVRAGSGCIPNHNESIVLKTGVKAGALTNNHNQTTAKPITVKTNVRAGGAVVGGNHNQAVARR